MKTLTRLHPFCCFLYFLAVLGITIFTRNPLMILESLLGALLLMLRSHQGGCIALLPLTIILGAVTNPLFSHNGVTVLFFVGDIAFTAESMFYGAAFGCMIAATVGWSICSAKYITGDKYIWLFGRVLPSAGLVLSCTLRFIPLIVRRTKSFMAAQQAESLSQQLRAFSASIGYSAEEAMTSADSMKARGYGCARRTSYSLYRFGRTEITATVITAVMLTAVITAMMLGGGEYFYYPALGRLDFAATDIAAYIGFGALCVLPSFTR